MLLSDTSLPNCLASLAKHNKFRFGLTQQSGMGSLIHSDPSLELLFLHTATALLSQDIQCNNKWLLQHFCDRYPLRMSGSHLQLSPHSIHKIVNIASSYIHAFLSSKVASSAQLCSHRSTFGSIDSPSHSPHRFHGPATAASTGDLETYDHTHGSVLVT